MGRLIVFACFLNEGSLLPYSLEQLDALPVHEIHVADGCFDLRYAEHSADGTHELLQAFARERDWVTLHRVVRFSKTRNIFSWLVFIFVRPRLKKFAYIGLLVRLFRIDNYRLNQAATFNKMLRSSSASTSSDWIMTYDADEFYNSDAVVAFANLGRYSGVVPIAERTFVGKLSLEAQSYPTTALRFWNVPHQFREFMRFLPPRLISWPESSRSCGLRRFRLRNAPTSGSAPAGVLFHYKDFNHLRFEAAYLLGDRKKPAAERLVTTDVEVVHPPIALRAFTEGEDG